VTPVLFDTGVIIAALLKRDPHHQGCSAFIQATDRRQRLVPATVIAEVAGMVEHLPEIEAAFYDSVAGGSFVLVQIENADLVRMAELVRQYRDFPLGGTDASVVAIAERLGVADVATLDHRHFRAIRPAHTPAFNLLP